MKKITFKWASTVLSAVLFFALIASCKKETDEPVLFDAKALRELTGLPLLGTVSRKMEDSLKLKMKKDLRRFIVAASSLFVAYGAGIGLLMFLGLRGA